MTLASLYTAMYESMADSDTLSIHCPSEQHCRGQVLGLPHLAKTQSDSVECATGVNGLPFAVPAGHIHTV